jgi:hypothetical protein
MQNRFWYLALIVIGSIMVAVVYWKSRNRHTFTLLFGMSGICYIIETLLHTTLKAYEFFPRFMQDSYDDSLWGGIISDLFVLPPAAVLVGVFQLGWGWIVVISGIISAIEELFLKLGIYEQNWWKTWYTFIGGILLFFFAKWWYRQLNRSHGRKLTFLTVVSILYCLNAKLYILIQNDLKHGRFFNKWIEAHGVNSTVTPGASKLVHRHFTGHSDRISCAVVVESGFNRRIDRIGFIVILLESTLSELVLAIRAYVLGQGNYPVHRSGL